MFRDLQIPSDVLVDFLMAPEANEDNKHELDIENQVENRIWQAKRRKGLVHKYFKKSAASLGEEKKKKTRPPNFFSAKNGKTKEATAWLLKHMPPTVS